MKFVVISDTHGLHEQLNIEPCDLLIHCGDFSQTGSYVDHVIFAKWLAKQPATYKIVVPGNHDGYSQSHPILIKDVFSDLGIHLLIDQYIEIEGKKIYGSPWTPRFGHWFWAKERGEDIKKYWDNIPSDLDILITHGPPKNVLDLNLRDNFACGCEELFIAVTNKKPKFHVFGHIHEFGGNVTKLGETTFLNAAVLDESYKMTNKIWIFEL
jgi:Icc-related predicted phosphoesterase